MLELKNIYKTFNPGTINEKVALNGLNLTLNEGDSSLTESTLPNYPSTKEQLTWDACSRIL